MKGGFSEIPGPSRPGYGVGPRGRSWASRGRCAAKTAGFRGWQKSARGGGGEGRILAKVCQRPSVSHLLGLRLHPENKLLADFCQQDFGAFWLGYSGRACSKTPTMCL